MLRNLNSSDPRATTTDTYYDVRIPEIALRKYWTGICWDFSELCREEFWSAVKRLADLFGESEVIFQEKDRRAVEFYERSFRAVPIFSLEVRDLVQDALTMLDWPTPGPDAIRYRLTNPILRSANRNWFAIGDTYLEIGLLASSNQEFLVKAGFDALDEGRLTMAQKMSSLHPSAAQDAFRAIIEKFAAAKT